MRTSAMAVLMAAVLILVLATPSHARHGHGEVFIGVGPAWWGPAYGGWYYPPPAYVVPPPPVIQEEEHVYVERGDDRDEPERYWYYCPSARKYYPDVRTCRKPWIKVPPRDDSER